ncbi:MAG: MFS transporter [Rhodospirillales bacterium]|nr:MFS transporter [Rhodospirillales bacterium]
MNKKALLVLLCGCAILLIGNGTRLSSGLYLGPISRDLGLDFQVFSLSLALQSLLIGLAQPFAGAVADKFGTARTIAGCGLLYIAGLAITANATSPLFLHIGAGLFIGLAASGISFAVILGAVGRTYPAEKRSFALGAVTAAGALGQLTLAPTNQFLIAGLGWTTSLLMMAALMGLVVPLAAALSGNAADAHDSLTENQTLTQALGEAGRHPSYLLLTAGFFVCGFQVMFVGVHLPNYLATLGYAELGGYAIGVAGLSNFFGTLLCGWLGGRHSRKYLLSLIYFTRAVIFLVFILAPKNPATILTFSACIGFIGLGTVPLTSGLVAQMFGVRYMSTLFAVVYMSHQLGAFGGTWLGGYMFDLTGSYDLGWQVAAGLGVFAGLIHLPISERRVQIAPVPT